METNDLATQVAAFRFGIIADFVGTTQLAWGEKSNLMREKASREYTIPGSQRSSISPATILYWINLYQKGGRRLESLMPKRRRDHGKYRKLDSSIRMAIRDLKIENPSYTVPVIIGKLRSGQLITPHQQLSKATIYRFLSQEELSRPSSDAADRRRFEADHSNEIWQCDVCHGPKVFNSEGKVRKAYLLAIIDDHSRLIIHAKFYESEGFDVLKIALREAVQRRGLPQKFYVDNGACYRATSLEHIAAALGIQLIHSRPYTPQGRGKIERWFRNIREDFLPRLELADITFEELNQKLSEWVEGYNNRPHSTTKMAPSERFKKNIECVRYAPSDLDRYFRKIVTRLVRKDRTVQYDNRMFEVPHTLIDRTVELHFHPEDPDLVEVFFDTRSYGPANLLDVSVNKRVGRESLTNDGIKTDEQLTRSDQIPSGSLFGRVVVDDDT